MTTLFSPQAGSPSTELSADITDTATEISVVDVSVLPDPPNILTMVDGDLFESVIYESVDLTTNILQNVTRGVEGTAQSWTTGQKISRLFTAKDLLDIQSAVEELQILTQDLWLSTDESTINSVTTFQALDTEESTINSVTTYQAVETDESTINSVTTNVS